MSCLISDTMAHLALFWHKLPIKGRNRLVRNRQIRFPNMDAKDLSAAIVLHPMFRNLMADHKGMAKGKIRIPDDVWEDAGASHFRH